jgi:hypothetical protein
MASARRWADEYGERLVRMALARLERRQHAIYKPAGFVKTILRSTKKFKHINDREVGSFFVFLCPAVP